MKFIPSKSQWSKWTLPSKATYVGTWVGFFGVLIAIAVSLFPTKETKRIERPMVSILSIDSTLQEDSMESKFSIENVGDQPAFFLIKCTASIDGKAIHIKNSKSETQHQTILPGQQIGYGGVTIKGTTLKKILNGNLVPEILQGIDISYGSSEKTIGEYNTFLRVKLNVDKLKKFNKSKVSDGVWLLERSDCK